MTQQGNRVPDASADEKTKAAATEDYGGVPISEQELADVWLADAGTDTPAGAGAGADAGDSGSAD